MENKIREIGRTDVNGDTANGWKEDLDVGMGDEFGVHTTRFFENGTAEECF